MSKKKYKPKKKITNEIGKRLLKQLEEKTQAICKEIEELESIAIALENIDVYMLTGFKREEQLTKIKSLRTFIKEYEK